MACTTGQACREGKCVVDDGCTGEVARNLALTRIDAFQTVGVSLVKTGAEVPVAMRNTDLVAGRETVFRVFVTPASGFTTREIAARITLVNGATTDEYSAKKSVSAASTEAETASTFQVTVPAAKVTATTQYHVELVECGTPPSGSATTPRFPTSGDASLGARALGALKVRVVPILSNNSAPDTSEAGLKPYKDLMEAMYPVASVEVSVATQISANYPIDWNGTLDAVRAKRQQDAPPADVYYYGLLKPTATFRDFCGNGCTAGIGFVPSQNDASRRVALGIGFADSQSAATMAHEVGHNHGRNHAPCVPQGGSISGVDGNFPYSGAAIGVWGYDQRTKMLVNPAGDSRNGIVTDIMGYCNSKWISDYTYDGIVGRVAFVNGAQSSYVNPDVLDTFRVLLLDAAGPRWGIPIDELTPPSGTAEVAEMLGADGGVIEYALVYRTLVSDIDAASIMVPAPRRGWKAVRIAGHAALLF
jgi:hypothetical protein